MESVWSAECTIPEREALAGDLKTDTVIIGGGLTGILTAYMLKERGVDAVVVEKKRIAGGVTKDTTAKITIQHSLIYDKLINEFGQHKAQLYASANNAALQKYKECITQKNIDCNFEELPAYVYSLEQTDRLQAEAAAAEALGIRAEVTDKTALPFAVKGALKFYGQAQFQPLAFIKAIAQDLMVFENTKSTGVEEDTVFTDKGKITAKHIVMAAHYPFVNMPGYYFMRMHQERSYIIALEHAQQLDGMYICADDEVFSFRNYKDLLLLGGGGHRTGKRSEESSYEKLRKVAGQWYPQAQEKYHWSAQDCMTLDEVPYIGEFSSSTPNMYVATGFNKWGMTSAMVSAMLLADKITGTKNEWEEMFTPQRFSVTASTGNLLKEGAQAVSGLTKQQFQIPKEDLQHLQNGQGGIVEYNGEKVGVYKDEDGRIFMVETQCSHLGCQLEWNSDELTWDCPCHGSRFDYKGDVINNPAINNLENLSDSV